MEREKTVGFCVRTLSVAIKRAVDAGKARSGLNCTGTHGWVIGYLYENRDKDVFQRDIEKQFSVRRPTMTQILQLMEKNGLIIRERDESDARMKRIKLTKTALDIHEQHERHIEAFEESLRKGISDEELSMFFDIIGRMHQNVTLAEKGQTPGKEDRNNA